MKYEYPEAFARFYDLIYHQKRDGEDNDFYLNEIRKVDGKILEIGVGTGRFFKEALDSGANIYGIDISPSMIDVISQKLDKEQRSRITLQNITDFNFDFRFDLIIAPFRVMMHVLDKDEQIKALNNVYNHLNKNGRFIFDAFIPDLSQLIRGLDHMTDFEGEYESRKKLKRTVSTRPDLINQLIHITFLLEWDENDNVKKEEWKVPLRYYFRYELEHLIERSDFSDYKILGDFQGNELSKNSKEFIMVCRK